MKSSGYPFFHILCRIRQESPAENVLNVSLGFLKVNLLHGYLNIFSRSSSFSRESTVFPSGV